MAISTHSHKPAPRHFGEVLDRILSDEELSTRRRQDFASALRAVAKAFGQKPEELHTDPALLRERLKTFIPLMAGLKQRRWDNVLSLSNVALEHVGIIRIPRRSRVAYAPKWTALFRLIKDMHGDIILSRLARYCTTREIAPEDVSDATFDALRDELTSGSTVRNPRQILHRAAVVWNQMVASEPAWPQHPVTVSDNRGFYALPWTTFPPSLKLDIDAYLDHLAGVDILAERDFEPLKPASLKTRTYQIHAFISAVVHRGIDPSTLLGLRDVVAIETFKSGSRFILDRSPGGSRKQAYLIAQVITGVAEHWVGVDADHLKIMRKICKRLDPGSEGMTQKNADRLRQFDDPANLDALLALPEKLVALAAEMDVPRRAEALLVQTAVAVELLLMVPMRRKNLVLLELDRHLIRGWNRVMHLDIPKQEIKNGTAINCVIRPHLVRLIDLYLSRYRPLLLTDGSRFLFPGSKNRPKTGERLAIQICGCIKERCGLIMNLHLFRHLTAKSCLDAEPGAYGLVRLLLGHKSVDTTTKYYCGVETTAAMARYDDHVLRLREKFRASPPNEGRNIVRRKSRA